ncbi:cytochrome c biogenesis CcdA family protein [Marinovum sp.]|uniref:cytochrome c biogenesis CcdA family protein n=1 Tax=Marinovum sp. TaxID=2024839 RepID=UPI002B26CABF|nr:cytochrome c biogenesis CcdA family protein [Marinovum sp.]
MEMLFAYAAGLLTLINPCVLPVLPIVLASALQSGRAGPVWLAAGMSLSFVTLGVAVTAMGHLVGLTTDDIAQAGAALMVVFGTLLLIPRAALAFSTATAGMAARADHRLDHVDRSTGRGQFLGGLLLGAVWSPCVGPTLGGAISLAAQGESLWRATVIMAIFAAGVSSLILGLAYLARSSGVLRRFATVSRPILGAVFIAVGLMLLFRLHHVIEAWALDQMPAWLIDLSVAF